MVKLYNWKCAQQRFRINEDGTLHVKREDGDENKTLDNKWIKKPKQIVGSKYIQENNIPT